MNTLNLEVPPEPKGLKREVLKSANSPKSAFLSKHAVYNSVVLGSGGLPKYLWDVWKPKLKSAELPWQVFLKAISACKYDIHDWIENKLSWENLISETIIPVIEKAAKGKYPLWPP